MDEWDCLTRFNSMFRILQFGALFPFSIAIIHVTADERFMDFFRFFLMHGVIPVIQFVVTYYYVWFAVSMCDDVMCC